MLYNLYFFQSPQHLPKKQLWRITQIILTLETGMESDGQTI